MRNRNQMTRPGPAESRCGTVACRRRAGVRHAVPARRQGSGQLQRWPPRRTLRHIAAWLGGVSHEAPTASEPRRLQRAGDAALAPNPVTLASIERDDVTIAIRRRLGHSEPPSVYGGAPPCLCRFATLPPRTSRAGRRDAGAGPRRRCGTWSKPAPRSTSFAVSASPRRGCPLRRPTTRFGRDCWPQGQRRLETTPSHTRLRVRVGPGDGGGALAAQLERDRFRVPRRVSLIGMPGVDGISPARRAPAIRGGHGSRCAFSARRGRRRPRHAARTPPARRRGRRCGRPR